jgi:hypothetical protein
MRQEPDDIDAELRGLAGRVDRRAREVGDREEREHRQRR